MVRIIMNNNNTFELEGKQKILIKLYKAFKLKHPGAFFLRKSGAMPKGWDGHVDYISETLKFRAGLLQAVYDEAIKHDKVEIVDNRREFDVKPKLITEIGKNILRPNQVEAMKAILNNKVGGTPHYLGVIDGATNFGKTTLMAAVYHAFKCKIPTIMLLKDADLFEQFKKELPDLIPKEDLGFVRGKEIHFNKFTVVMVQTLSPKVKEYVNQLSKFGICLVDEADEGESKSYKNIITRLYNARIRIGLSGTIYMSKLAKDRMKNRNLESFFGKVLIKITKMEMVEAGYSTRVVVTLLKGSTLPGIKGYPEEYKTNITENKARAKIGAERLARAARFYRLPALVVYRFHDHGKLLLKVYRKRLPKLRIELVHGDVKNRKQLMLDFRDGKIDVLISSMIVKRGKNFPLIKYIQNASATDSNETVSQVMGRGERKHESKSKYYLDDFWDEGRYLNRHSKHRKKYYLAEGFTVLLKY
jgi:superfamily II DNA or RNA helicase